MDAARNSAETGSSTPSSNRKFDPLKLAKDVKNQEFFEEGLFVAKLAVPYVLGGLTALLVAWRARRKWNDRQFASRLNISLTSLDEHGVLRLRTLAETDVAHVVPSTFGLEMLLKHATASEGLVKMPGHASLVMQTAFLNDLSSRCAAGHIAKDMGQPVNAKPYVYGLVYDQGAAAGFKLRLVVASLATLRNAVTFAFEKPKFVWNQLPEQQRKKRIVFEGSVFHSSRFGTLLDIHRALHDQGLDVAALPFDADYATALKNLDGGPDYSSHAGSSTSKLGLLPIVGLVELASPAYTPPP